MRSLYCTADIIGTETGGGVVTYNELEALKSVSETVGVIERKDIELSKWRQPDSPFLLDYLASMLIKDKQFDLAHFYSGCFSDTVRWLKSQGTKISYTVAAHDRKTTVEEFERLGLKYPFPHIKDDDLWQIYSEGYRLADVVVAPSKRSAEFLKAEGCRKVVIIPHGVNLKEVKSIPDRFDVCYLGAVGPDKGVLYLIQAWTMLNYPDSNLILAGGGTETLELFIRQVANQGQFKILGRVPNVSDVYNDCSVAVFPSVTEGFGIGILEAMAHGRPVIASEGAGASDLVEDGITGFVVPIRDPRAIAQKIDWLKKNRNKIPEMGQRARRKARNYTWQRIRGRYKKVFLGDSNGLS